ncbi:MAG: aspartate aminotransferase family protein [Acidiferrobacteraceae bacterium]|nr:aspartate aminotransferase family protein [Acidiferrobacteraceae bacterium]
MPADRLYNRSSDIIARDEALITGAMKYRLYPFSVARANGVYLWDADDNEYIDFMAVGGAIAAGHAHPKIRRAIESALDDGIAHPLVCYNHQPAVDLAEKLVDFLPGRFETKVWFGVSGSDAMDFLAKVVPLASGRPRLISFSGAFHGMTIGSGGISGHAALSKPIPNGHITKAPFPNPNNCSWGPCEKSGCSLKCLDFLEKEILGILSPPQETAAIFAEIIQSDSGEIIPPANYFPALQELCNSHGIWLILDEIKTGLGRTGRMFAFEKYGISPDAFAIAKPLGGGLPISAVIGRAEIFDADLYTAYTLGGSALPCISALALLDVIEAEKLVDNAKKMGQYLVSRLNKIADTEDMIAEVRGEGLLVGVELQHKSNSPESISELTAALARRCFENGLILLAFGNVIEMTPPLVINQDQIDQALAIFTKSIKEVGRA